MELLFGIAAFLIFLFVLMPLLLKHSDNLLIVSGIVLAIAVVAALCVFVPFMLVPVMIALLLYAVRKEKSKAA